MEENRTAFGRMPDGTQVDQITLRDGAVTCRILTYGGAVRSLIVPDRAGNPVDVALGFDPLEDYMAQDKYMGALVGRYANRIGGAKFTLNGAEYPLYANDGPNSLHGGQVGFDKKVWAVEALTDSSVTLSLTSPDGEEGYPGTLDLHVTYALSMDRLIIIYRAECDKDTVLNPTNHTYFNLSGHDSGSVEGQYIQLFASRYTPTVPGSIPTGKLAPVDGTPMDLRAIQPIGAHIGDPFDQLTMAGGYDHNWVVDDRAADDQRVSDLVLDDWEKQLRLAALSFSPDTGIAMSAHTTLPGVQFYTGNFIEGCPPGKGGAVYHNRHGFCLETQFFPDTPNQPGFPPCILKAGEMYESTTSYRFFYPAPSALGVQL